MAKSKGSSTIGSWAFLIGVILAVILGALGVVEGTWTAVLVVLGLIVGILNITDEEVRPFLTAGTVLVLVSFLGRDVLGSVALLGNILNAVMALFVPATVIVALKSVFSLAKK